MSRFTAAMFYGCGFFILSECIKVNFRNRDVWGRKDTPIQNRQTVSRFFVF